MKFKFQKSDIMRLLKALRLSVKAMAASMLKSLNKHNLIKLLKARRTKIVAAVMAVVLLVGTVSAVSAYKIADEKTLLQKILDRDGFLYSIAYTKFSTMAQWGPNDIYGTTENAFSDGVGISQVTEDAYNIKQLGYNMVNLYAMGWDCEGIKYGPNGSVLGIYDEWLQNYEKYLQILVDNGLDFAIWLHLHETSIAKDHSIEQWNQATQFYCNPEVRKDYMDKVMSPLLDMLKKFEDHIVYLSLGDELQNSINDSEVQINTENDRSVYGTTLDNMNQFIYDLNDLVKAKMPAIPRTISCNLDMYQYYEGLGLTFFGHNNYHASGKIDEIEGWKTSLPFMASEYGLPAYVNDTDFQKLNLKMINSYRNNPGYIGANWWYYRPAATSGDFSIFNKDYSFRSDFNDLAALFSFDITDAINEHKQDFPEFENARMFYNSGAGRVTWLQSRQAITFDLERSLDGGNTWEKLVTGGDPLNYKNKECLFMGYYEDTSIQPGQTACYRVVSYDENGNSLTSNPTNLATRKPFVYDSMVNGSFEDGLNNWETPQEKAQLKIVDTVPGTQGIKDGSKALMIEKSGYQDKWNTFLEQTVKAENLKPNTAYEFSMYYMRADEGATPGYNCRILEADKTSDSGWKELRVKYLSASDAKQNEWYKVNMEFNTGDTPADIKIILQSGEEGKNETQYYDAFSIYEIQE